MLKFFAVGRVASASEVLNDPGTGKEYMILEVSSIRRYRDQDGNYLRDTVPVKLRHYQAQRYQRMGFVGCKIAIYGDFEVRPEKPYGFMVKAQEVEYLTFRKPEEAAEATAYAEADPAVFDAA